VIERSLKTLVVLLIFVTGKYLCILSSNVHCSQKTLLSSWNRKWKRCR